MARRGVLPVPGRRMRDVAMAARLAFLAFPALATVLLAVGGGVEAGDWYPWAFVTTLAAGSLLLFDVVRPRRGAGTVAGAAFAALALLTVASTAWAVLPGQAFMEGARALFYLATFALVLAAVRDARDGRALVALIAAACGGIELLAAARLATAPPASWFIYERLDWPTGYPNTAASVGVLAFWSLAGVAARRDLLPPLRALAGGAASVALGVALLCESRGGLYSFVLATPVALVVLRERLRLGAFAALAVVPVAVSWPAIEPALTTGASSAVQHAVRVLLACALGGALVTALAAAGDRRLHLEARARRRVAQGVLAGVVVVLAAASAVALARNAPHRVASAWRTFSGQQQDTDSSGDRLLTFGSNRYDFWRVALDDLRSRPLDGYGAGGFGPTYLRLGRSEETPAQAHGQAFELAATLGAPGLLLALVPAAIGLAGLAGRPRPGRREAEDTILAGAFAAALCVLVHAQADWHWQSAAVSVPLVALLAAGAALQTRNAAWSAPAVRAAGAVLVAAAILWVLPGLLSVRLQERAANDGDLGAARLAARLDPFGTDALLTLSALESADGERDAALRHARESTRREPGNWVTWSTLARLAPTISDRRAACRRARSDNPRLVRCQ